MAEGAAATVAYVVAAVATAASAAVTTYSAIQQGQEAKAAATEDALNRQRVAGQLHEQYVQQLRERQKQALRLQGTNIAQASKAGFMVSPGSSVEGLLAENELTVAEDAEALWKNYTYAVQDLNYAGTQFQKKADAIVNESTVKAFGSGLTGAANMFSITSKGAPSGSKAS